MCPRHDRDALEISRPRHRIVTWFNLGAILSAHISAIYLGDISRQVSLRNVRREAIDKIKKLQKEGLSEDQSKEAQVDLGWISGRSRGDLG